MYFLHLFLKGKSRISTRKDIFKKKLCFDRQVNPSLQLVLIQDHNDRTIPAWLLKGKTRQKVVMLNSTSEIE